MRIIYILFCFITFSSFSQVNLEWSIFHPVKKEWLDLGMKGSVQEALIATGEMPDPFYGTNENKFGWIEDHEWEFKSIFFIKHLDSWHYELNLPSVDTYAKVYLNDSLILETENAFIPYNLEVKKWLKVGMNQLTIVFTPPVIYHKNKKSEVGYQLPAPNDVHEVAIAPYSRKPQYQFGWDWALRMNTIGLNKPAYITFDQFPKVLNKSTNILSVDNEKAVVEFTMFLSNNRIKEFTWESELFGKEKVECVEGVVKCTVEIENPILWWPRGQGEQYLYSDKVNLLGVESGQVLVESNYRFGIKTSELVQEKDQWGTSYYFKINGRRVFAKGADYIPQEIFPARVEDQEVRELVETMAESNFNMVRVWGGGYYPDEVFFEACDELGLMVWQDLMFACAMYPGDQAFLDNIRKEFEYHVPRIGGHASVVLFNGNNEVEVAWGNWGFQIKHGLYGKSAKEIEKAYDDIFKLTAPQVIDEWSTVPYVHTSPLSNWGKMELYNHGSQHYWGVWHGKDPIEDFGKKIGRFNAEYGFQSFPEYSTLNSFSKKEDWDLSSEVMKHHQKSYVGNDMILKHAKRLYGQPKDFDEFVYYSQLTQAMAVSMAVAGHRIDAPRCGGTLYWQLNDCWPAPTWSSIDYFGNWKALQYQMKNDFQDVSVVAKFNSLSDIEYHLVSDVPDTLSHHIECIIYNLKGEQLSHGAFDVGLSGESSALLNLETILKNVSNKENILIVFKFKDQNGAHTYRQFERIPSKYTKAKDKDVELELVDVDTEQRTATIEVCTKKFLRNVWISANIPGVKFDRNFESLLPGNHRFQIEFDDLDLNEVNWKMIWL